MVNYEQILCACKKKCSLPAFAAFLNWRLKCRTRSRSVWASRILKRRGRFAAPAFSLWKKGQTFYTSNWGLPSCAIRLPRSCAASTACATMRTRRSFVTVGGSEAIDNTIRALVNVGDEVLIPEPSFCVLQAADPDGGRRARAAADPRGGPVQADGGQSARRYYAAHQAAHPAVPEQPDRRDHDAR